MGFVVGDLTLQSLNGANTPTHRFLFGILLSCKYYLQVRRCRTKRKSPDHSWTIISSSFAHAVQIRSQTELLSSWSKTQTFHEPLPAISTSIIKIFAYSYGPLKKLQNKGGTDRQDAEYLIKFTKVFAPFLPGCSVFKKKETVCCLFCFLFCFF